MRESNDERERPTEWLRRLTEDRARLAELLADSESFALAAYRVARARLRTQPTGASRIPTAAELKVAAAEICRRTGLTVTYPLSQLVDDCEHAGFPVIPPITSERAA